MSLEKRRSDKPGPDPELEKKRQRQAYLDHRKMLRYTQNHQLEAHPIERLRRYIPLRQNDLQKILDWIQAMDPPQQQSFASLNRVQSKLKEARRKLIAMNGIIAEHDNMQKNGDVRGMGKCLEAIQEFLDQYYDLITQLVDDFR